MRAAGFRRHCVSRHALHPRRGGAIETARDSRSAPERSPNRPSAAHPESASADRKQIYLRTIYPQNNGIPHTVDFPELWND